MQNIELYYLFTFVFEMDTLSEQFRLNIVTLFKFMLNISLRLLTLYLCLPLYVWVILVASFNKAVQQ